MTIKHTCHDVANHFLRLANESGSLITHMKLQKLVYYAQAWHLAIFKRPLFDEDFQAWVHGPVCTELWDRFKGFGYHPIGEDVQKVSMTRKTAGFLDEVTEVYMKHDAFALELMTHREDPWIEARGECAPEDPCKNIISKESMQRFYEQRLQKTGD